MNQTFFERLRKALAPQYRLERELGAGGMGSVYLARDTTLDVPVAIKVMRPEIATATARERFLLEARILRRLRHPGIVQVHFADERDGLSFYVMDLVEGETLDRRLEKGPLSESEVMELGRDLLAALETAHRQGVIHRDVKPSNIFLLDDRAVLVDFGIARSLGQEGSRLTVTDQMPPITIAYAAPEQLAGEAATAATDIYAVGMVLFEAATGRRWVTGTSPGQADWTGVRGRLARALRRALAVSPEDRWPDAASFRKAFSARPGSVTPGRALAGIAAAAGIAATIYLVFFYGRDGGDGPQPTTETRFGRDTVPRDIAVLPFELVTSWEAGIDGEGIAALVARELEGTGEITLVPVQLSFSQTDTLKRKTSLPERFAARALNARYAVGAQIWVHQDDDSLEARLSVYNASGTAVPGLSQIFVHSSQPELLSSEIALELLRIVFGGRDSMRLKGLSDSWEAVKDWTNGERAFRRGAWSPAVGHYRSAVERDTTFILAWWRLANAYRWLLEPGPLPVDFDRLYELYGERLGPVDSTLVAAQLAPAGPLRFEIYEQVRTEHGLDYFAAYLLGEELFNRGPLFGRPLEDAADVLEEAIKLNPLWTPAYVHLAWAYIRLGQRADAERVLDDLIHVSASPEEVGFLHPEVFRQAYRERFQPDIARQVRPEFFADTGRALLDKLAALSRLAGSVGVPRSQVELGEMLRHEGARIRSYRADGHVAQGLGLVGLGRLDSAIVHFDSMAAILATPEARLQAAQWRLIPAALGLPEGSASAAEAPESLLAMDRSANDSLAARIAWTLMFDAYGRGDTTAALGWGDSLTAWAGSLDIRPLSGLARALRRAARDDFAGALALSEPLLAHQVRTHQLRGRRDGTEPVHDVFDRAALHLLRAAWYEELGDWDRMERELMWYEAVDIEGNPRGGPPKAGEIDWALGVFAEYKRGLNDVRREEEVAACTHLGHAIELWRDAGPPFARLVGWMRNARPGSCRTDPGNAAP